MARIAKRRFDLATRKIVGWAQSDLGAIPLPPAHNAQAVSEARYRISYRPGTKK